MSLENYEYVKEIAAEAIRLDERKPLEGRKLTIKKWCDKSLRWLRIP